MSHDEMIAVIQAHKEGKQIEGRWKEHSDATWFDLPLSAGTPHGFDFFNCIYRVKPDPREWVLVPLAQQDGEDLYALRPLADARLFLGTIHVREVNES